MLVQTMIEASTPLNNGAVHREVSWHSQVHFVAIYHMHVSHKVSHNRLLQKIKWKRNHSDPNNPYINIKADKWTSFANLLPYSTTRHMLRSGKVVNPQVYVFECPYPLQISSHFDRGASQTRVKLQSDWKTLNSDLISGTLCKILRQNVVCDIETAPTVLLTEITVSSIGIRPWISNNIPVIWRT